jgi:hypothetical protein
MLCHACQVHHLSPWIAIIQDRKGLLTNESGYRASQAPDAGEASQDE